MSVILDGEELVSPVKIAPNLQAGILIDEHWVTIGYSNRRGEDGRTKYRWEIIFPNGDSDFDNNIESGAQGGNLMKGMADLLSFLSAAAETWLYGERKEPLFPLAVIEFACGHSDEISMLETEIEKINRT